MKKKDMISLRTKTAKELAKIVYEKQTEATKKKMEIMGGKEKNLKAHKNLSREIAKILTLIREKEIIEKIEAESKEGETK